MVNQQSAQCMRQPLYYETRVTGGQLFGRQGLPMHVLPLLHPLVPFPVPHPAASQVTVERFCGNTGKLQVSEKLKQATVHLYVPDGGSPPRVVITLKTTQVCTIVGVCIHRCACSQYDILYYDVYRKSPVRHPVVTQCMSIPPGCCPLAPPPEAPHSVHYQRHAGHFTALYRHQLVTCATT